MQLNGWQRLFCFVFAVLGCLLLGIWVLQRPSDGFATYSCDSPYFATRAEAQRHLDENSYAERDYATQSNCRIELESIASGDRLAKAQSSWWNDFKVGAITLGILAAVVYALGCGIGWVWRGFRPKHRSSP